MPELPEVETIVRDLNKKIHNQTIKNVVINYSKAILPLSPTTFNRRLKNNQIIKVTRRAKIIIIHLSDNLFLLIHLKMTGQLIYVPTQGKVIYGGHPQVGGGLNLPNKYTRIIINFIDGSTLYFNDLRKFGWLKLVEKIKMDAMLKSHGPEPLSKHFSETTLKAIFSRYLNRTIKQTLLDQTLLAGLGNIYVDEACFLAKLKPDRKNSTLTKNEIEKLRNSIIAILKLAIKKKGTSAKNYLTASGTPGGFVKYLNVYGRAKDLCHVCNHPIEKIKHAGRGTHFCPQCQK